MIGDEDLVDPERRIRGQFNRAVEAAECIGLEFLGQELLAFGIPNLDGEPLVGEIEGVGLIVAGMGHPELEPYRLARTIDGAIGDQINPLLVVFRVVRSAHPRWERTRGGPGGPRASLAMQSHWKMPLASVRTGRGNHRPGPRRRS